MAATADRIDRVSVRIMADLLGVTVEEYAARRAKNSPGQMSLWDDNATGGNLLRTSARQKSFDWDESKHPRAEDGKFAEAGAAGKSGGGGAAVAEADEDEPEGPGDDEGKQDPPAKPSPEPEPEDEPSPIAPPEPDPAKTPRENAEAAQRKLDADYEFARASAISNAGEDLKGSARHIRNQWLTLEDAEGDGTADHLVTRDQLLKNEPHSLAMHAESNPVGSLMLHEVLRAFPPKPGYGSRNVSEEAAKKNRANYLDVYRKVKGEAEKIAASGESQVQDISRAVGKIVADEIRRLRATEGKTDDTANGLVNYYGALSKFWQKSSIATKVSGFLSEAGISDPDSPDGKAADIALQVMEGKTFSQILGREKGPAKPKGFSEAELYVATAERTGGPELPVKTAKESLDYLIGKVGLRGVQFGNSVSDAEREHHAKMAAGAMLDLADMTGLPLEAVSLGGKLGLAMGARGKGNALAHYEPGTKVINLTRKGGVGSLAHEWGHAFDNIISADYARKNTPYLSEDAFSPETPVSGAMKALRIAWDSSGYKSRLRSELQKRINNKTMTAKKANDYWNTNLEIFARSFERHIQRKLEKGGRKSTYLAGIESKAYKSGGLWPTDEEVDKMAPEFDRLFDAYREHGLKIADRVKYSAADRDRLADRFIAEMLGMTAERYESERAELTTGKHGDRGRYVTTDNGSQIFLTKSGEIGRTGKNIGGGDAVARGNQPASDPQSLPGGDSAATGGRSQSTFVQSFAQSIIANIRKNEQSQQYDQPAGPAPESHPHHHSKLPPQLRQSLLNWSADIERLAQPIGWARHGAGIAGNDNAKGVMKSAFDEINKAELSKVFQKLDSLIAAGQQQGIDLRPFVKHNNLVPRTIAAKLKPSDLFHPVRDEERYAARAKNSPGQLSLWDDNATGSNMLRTSARQKSFDWDESKHPRAEDGKFAEVGRTTPGSKPAEPSPPKKPERKTYDQLKAEYEGISEKYPKGTKENSFAFRDWLKTLSREEFSEWSDTKDKEDRFKRRSESGKQAAKTRQRRKTAAEDQANDPAGKMVQEISKKRDSLMKRWQYTRDESEIKRIDEEMARTEEPFRIAQKHWRLRQAHKSKDNEPHTLRRNQELPTLGSEGNKQETKGERQDVLIPWSVGFTGGNGERRIIVAGASLHDSEVGKGTAYVQLKDANGKDGIRDGLLIHFDRGDQEKNKRARQLVWAINNGKAEDVSFEKLQEFVMGDSIDHHHSDYKKTPRGVADSKAGPKAPRGFSFAQHVKLAADSIDKLRKSDVSRLIESTPDAKTAQFVADEIGKQRPDLKSEADESIYDYMQEVSMKYAASQADAIVDRFMAEAMGLTTEQYAARKVKSSPGSVDRSGLTCNTISANNGKTGGKNARDLEASGGVRRQVRSEQRGASQGDRQGGFPQDSRRNANDKDLSRAIEESADNRQVFQSLAEQRKQEENLRHSFASGGGVHRSAPDGIARRPHRPEQGEQFGRQSSVPFASGEQAEIIRADEGKGFGHRQQAQAIGNDGINSQAVRGGYHNGQGDSRRQELADSYGQGGDQAEKYAAKKQKGQQEFQWITVTPPGHDKGTPVMIDRKDGTIKAGMGGKFDGKKIGEIGGKGGSGEAKPAQVDEEIQGTSNKLKIFEASLKKKEDEFDRKLAEHFDSVKSANGQPLNDKRNGYKTLDRWERQNDSLRSLQQGIEKTKQAIEKEKNKIANVNDSDTPQFIQEMVDSGELSQWRKYPNRFFVKGVEKGRIVWDAEKQKLTAQYVSEVPKDQYPTFRDAFNKANASLRKKASEGESEAKTEPAKPAGESAKPEGQPAHPFAQSAMKGKIREASGQKMPGEESSSSWYETGKINNYSDEDIQKFYLGRALQTAGKLTAKDFEKGFDSAINSAVSRGDVTDKIASAASAAFDRGKQQAGSKPAPAPSSFTPEMIPGQQASLFGGDDLNTGQKSLFNMVRPTKADQRAAKRDAGPAPASLLEQIDDEQKKVAESRRSLPGQRDLLAGDGDGDADSGELPQYAVKAGIKSWEQAKKKGLHTAVTESGALANAAAKNVASYLNNPTSIANEAAKLIIERTATLGNMREGVKMVADHFDRMANANREPGHVHYGKFANELRKLNGEFGKEGKMQFSADQVDRFIERYRAGSSTKKADTKPKTVTGSKGDRGRFITVGEGDAAHPVFLPGSVKKIKETGEYRTDNSQAKAKEARKKNKAAGGGAGKFVPVTKIEKSIVETVGDHPDDVREFRSIVDKTYSEMANEARDKIAAIREITAMAGYDRSNAGGFIRSIRAARDYDKIPRFDQMADYAKRAFPGVLAPKMREAGGSHEQALFELLKDGIPEMPDKHSREVMDEAWNRSGYDQTGKPSEWATEASNQDEDDDFVPFSASLAARMSIERYRANPRAVGAPQFMRSR